MGSLDGRVAVITAGSTGIGFGIAQAFIAEGASVVIGNRDEKKGDYALERLKAGDRAVFKKTDALVREQVDALIDFAVEKYGKIDILVNCAGGSDGWALVGDLSDEAWLKGLEWNASTAFWGTRRALKYMIPQQFGRIIGMSSMYGKISTMAVPGYITNKHAIIGLMKAVAKEVGTQGITANAICPGFVPTDMFYETGPATVEAMGLPDLDALAQLMYSITAIQRPNTVEEVAAACVLLASDLGGGITGTTINVDGGASPY